MLIVVMMGRWSDDNACWVVHDVRLYSVLDTVVISGDNVCCSVVFGTLLVLLLVVSLHIVYSLEGTLLRWLVCLCLVLCGPTCWWHLILVILCGHQCTSVREWSVHSHLQCGMFSMCCMQCCMSVSAVFCALMCCLEDVYKCLQLLYV